MHVLVLGSRVGGRAKPTFPRCIYNLPGDHGAVVPSVSANNDPNCFETVSLDGGAGCPCECEHGACIDEALAVGVPLLNPELAAVGRGRVDKADPGAFGEDS